MALTWIRLDTALPDNPKVLGLLEVKEGHRAAFVYICGLAYAGKHGTDGFLPTACLARINGRRADAQKLVTFGLWQPVMGGWEVNGWSEFQLSNEETQNRRKKAQAAANVRWHGSKEAGGASA